MSQEEKFKEIFYIDDQEFWTREGTIEELDKLEKAQNELRLSNKEPLMAKASADDVINVSKFVWQIIKDNKAAAATEATTSRILSATDDNWQNYELAQDFASRVYTHKLNNFMGVNCYTVSFKVAGTYRAVNPEIGGKWIPNVHITFTKCSSNWPWQINGSAIIDSTFVSNKGTKEEPLPQLVLNVKINTDATVESRERTFEFTLNAQDGVKLIN